MNLIVSVNKDWKINERQFLLKGNKKYLQDLTRNKVVVYDESFLLKEANMDFLKDKIKVCFSINGFEKGENVFDDLSKMFEAISFYNTDNIFVVGGENFYKRMFSYCNKAFVTKIEEKSSGEKDFFNLDKDQNWELVKTSNPLFEDGIVYYFCEYVNKKPLKYNYGYEEEDLV